MVSKVLVSKICDGATPWEDINSIVQFHKVLFKHNASVQCTINLLGSPVTAGLVMEGRFATANCDESRT